MKTDIDKYLNKNINNIYNTASIDNSIKKEIGISEEVVKRISKEKGEPKWMLEIGRASCRERV